ARLAAPFRPAKSLPHPRAIRRPRRDQPADIRRMAFVNDTVIRNRHPGLRTLRPDMPDRVQPACVVERAGLDDRDLVVGAWMIDRPNAAGFAHIAFDAAAAIRHPLPAPRFALDVDKRRT